MTLIPGDQNAHPAIIPPDRHAGGADQAVDDRRGTA